MKAIDKKNHIVDFVQYDGTEKSLKELTDFFNAIPKEDNTYDKIPPLHKNDCLVYDKDNTVSLRLFFYSYSYFLEYYFPCIDRSIVIRKAQYRMASFLRWHLKFYIFLSPYNNSFMFNLRNNVIVPDETLRKILEHCKTFKNIINRRFPEFTDRFRIIVEGRFFSSLILQDNKREFLSYTFNDYMNMKYKKLLTIYKIIKLFDRHCEQALLIKMKGSK